MKEIFPRRIHPGQSPTTEYWREVGRMLTRTGQFTVGHRLHGFRFQEAHADMSEPREYVKTFFINGYLIFQNGELVYNPKQLCPPVPGDLHTIGVNQAVPFLYAGVMIRWDWSDVPPGDLKFDRDPAVFYPLHAELANEVFLLPGDLVNGVYDSISGFFEVIDAPELRQARTLTEVTAPGPVLVEVWGRFNPADLEDEPLDPLVSHAQKIRLTAYHAWGVPKGAKLKKNQEVWIHYERTHGNWFIIECCNLEFKAAHFRLAEDLAFDDDFAVAAIEHEYGLFGPDTLPDGHPSLNPECGGVEDDDSTTSTSSSSSSTSSSSSSSSSSTSSGSIGVGGERFDIVWNPQSGCGPTAIDGRFEGVKGCRGQALWDNELERWWIFQIDCSNESASSLPFESSSSTT